MMWYAARSSQYSGRAYAFDGVANGVIVWRSFGSGGSVPPPVAVAQPDGPHGPGFNLFYNVSRKKIVADTLRDEIAGIIDRIGRDQDNPAAASAVLSEAREAAGKAAREIRSVASEDDDIASRIEALRHIDLGAEAILARLMIEIGVWDASESDDLEALELMARLA